jgi:glycine dehydrogenase
MAGMYGVYHGSDGLRKIAERIHLLTVLSDKALKRLGIQQVNEVYFDTLEVEVKDSTESDKLKSLAERAEINLRYFDGNKIGVSFGEADTLDDIANLISVFSEYVGRDDEEHELSIHESELVMDYNREVKRTTPYLTHPVFEKYRTETELMRYKKA